MEWYIFAAGCAIFAGMAAIVEKKTLLKEHALEFAGILGIFNLILVLPLVFFLNINFPTYIFGIIISAALLGSVAFIFIAKAMRHMEISSASPLLNFEPGLLVLLAFLILGEKLTEMQIIGIIMLIIGSYLLEIDYKQYNLMTPIKKIWESKYIHYICIAMILYSFSSICDKYILGYVEPATYMFFVHIFLAIFLVSFMLLFKDSKRKVEDGIKSAWKWILLVAILTVSYRFFQLEAVSMAYVSLVIPIKRSSTLIATLIGGELFHEKNLMIKVISCIVMLFGVYLVVA